MAREVSITIKNMAQIKSAFNKAPQLMTKELNKAIPKAVLVVKRQSMINTPVDTGRLRASHKTIFSSLRGTIFPNANYGYWVHEGTKYMQGRPFLADAVESEDDKVQGYFVKAVDNVLSSIGKAT